MRWWSLKYLTRGIFEFRTNHRNQNSPLGIFPDLITSCYSSIAILVSIFDCFSLVLLDNILYTLFFLSWTVWVYATLSILVISLCGLLGVAVIPFMQQVFYHQLIQFLVALAVGTLCGDALLHLLPHVNTTLLFYLKYIYK